MSHATRLCAGLWMKWTTERHACPLHPQPLRRRLRTISLKPKHKSYLNFDPNCVLTKGSTLMKAERENPHQISFLKPEDAYMVHLMRSFLAEASKIYETRTNQRLDDDGSRHTTIARRREGRRHPQPSLLA